MGLLVILLLAQLLLAAEARAANWVVNINDTGFDPIPLGGTVTYTVTVENEDLATNTAPENSLNLSIPASFTLTGTEPGSVITGCAPLPAAGAATVSCTVPPLAGGQSATLRLRVLTSAQGTFTVAAQVPTLGIDTEPANNLAQQPTTVTAGTDLKLQVTGPPTVASGSGAAYGFTVTNLGPLPASNVVVTVPVPSGLAGIVLPAGCVLAASNYACTIPGPLAVGASAGLSLSGQVSVAATSTITVNGVIDSSEPPDLLTLNNAGRADTTVTNGSDVKITKSRAPSGTLLVGNAVTFTLTPSYTGDEPYGLTITDAIPPNYSIDDVVPSPASGWSCAVAGQTVTCTKAAGSGAGDNVPLGPIAILTTAVSGGTPVNRANIDSDGPPDPNLANNTATDGGAVINDRAADLRANKSGPANPPTVLEGEPFDFSISTTNLGNQPFTGTVVMTDSLPAGLRVDSYAALNGWNCATALPVTGPAAIACSRDYTDASPLAVRATTPAVTLRTVSTAPGATSFTNSMTVTTVDPNFPDPYLPNNTITYGVNSTGNGNHADLKVLKRALDSPIASGEVENFTIEIVNLGNAASASVTLTDDFTTLINNRTGAANGLGDVSWSPNAANGMNCSLAGLGGAAGTSGRLTCTITSLPVCTEGADCPVVNVSVRPGGNAGTRTNTARAISNVTFDPDIANNTGSASFEITARADVTVSKTVNPPSPVAGQAFTYVIAAATRADGRSAADDVTITDVLPDGLIFISARPSTGSCSIVPAALEVIISPATPGLLVCNLGTIANGAQQTVTVTAVPTTEIRNTTITNIAEVSSPTTPGDDPANNTASVNAPIQPPALDLQINKADTPLPDFGPDPVGVGSNMVYGLIVNNNGPSAVQQVVVTDTLPAGSLAFQSVSAPPGVNCTAPPAGTVGGSVSCTIPLLLSGERRIISLTMSGENRGVAVNSASVVSLETGLGFDTNPLNNQDSESTTVRTRADVEVVSKIPSKTPVSLLETFGFEIRIRNNIGPGLSEADTTVLSDTLPAGMRLTGVPSAVVNVGTTSANVCSGTAGGSSFTCEFGTMSAGAEVLVTAPVQVVETTGARQVFTNTASIATSSLEENLANNASSGQVTVEAASLAGRVFRDFNGNGAQDPGDAGVGGISMQLAGAGPAGVQVNLAATTTSDGSYVFSAVAPGTFTVTRGAVNDPAFSDGIATPGTVGGSALGPSAIGGIPLGTAAATGYDFTLVPNTGIAISKALLSGPTINPDGSFDAGFRLTVSNPSPETLQAITVGDQLAGPAPLFGSQAVSPEARGTYAVVSSPSGSCGGLNAGFNGGSDAIAAQGFTLAVGESCTIDFTIRVMPAAPLPPLVNGGRYVNQATAQGTGLQSRQVLSSQSNLVMLSPELPELAIAKVLTGYADADGSGTVTIGDVLNFKITATNTGSIVLTGVLVSDNRITPNSATCAVLQPGETCVLTGDYTVAIADVQAGSVVNTATADSNETDPVTATVTTPVVAVVDKDTLTKTALISTAKRGEKVPYVIAAQDVPFNPARIVDVMPPGFAFVEGSAVANGINVTPAVDGRRLTFDGLVPDTGGDIKLELTLIATASVNPGVAVNQAQLVNPNTGAVVASARARVTILAEAVFDCGDIIGKVFDDRNHNGYPDEGEPGLAAVRVATVQGLLVTTDAEGRFNIPCADIPDADIGSNFILKLDTGTLPTGYHLTTENPRRVRLTRGKIVKLNFGASISRLVRLELNGKVFAPGASELLPKWEAGLDRLVTTLQAETSVLEITYRGSDGALAKARLRAVKDAVSRRWSGVPGHYDLVIGTRIVAGGAP